MVTKIHPTIHSLAEPSEWWVDVTVRRNCKYMCVLLLRRSHWSCLERSLSHLGANVSSALLIVPVAMYSEHLHMQSTGPKRAECFTQA